MSGNTAVKPADRLLFIIALAALGTALFARLGLKTEKGKPEPQGLRHLAVGVEEDGGLGAEDLEILIAGSGAGIKAGGEGADILIGGGRPLAEGIGRGLYLPLDHYQRPEPPSPRERWALPLVSAVNVLVYNIPLLKEAGFNRPPRTRGELLHCAQALKAGARKGGKPGPYGFALALGPQDSRGLDRDIYPWFHAAGLPLVKDGRPEFGGDRYTETLEFLSRLNQEGLIAPGTFTATGAERLEEFIRGNIAMLIVSSRELRRLRESMGDDTVGLTLVPPADNYTGQPALSLSTWYAGIRAASPRPDDAWALLGRLEERKALLAESLALVPGAGSYGPYISGDPLLDKAWGICEVAELVPESLELPGAEPLETALRGELERMFRRQSPQSPRETAEAIRRAWGQWQDPEKL